MTGHWLFGYGYVGVGPGNDNTDFHWEHQDLTNIYIHILARAGLIALIPYLIVNFLYYRRLYQAARYATTQSDVWLIWCFAAALVGWNISMMTVSALAQIETLLFMFIALCANMPAIMKSGATERSVLPDDRAPAHEAPRAPRVPRIPRRPRRPITWGFNNV
jgi:O-antigen ligase